MKEVEAYFRELREIRDSGAGTDETSFYAPLEHLLNAVGKGLKPSVRCFLQLRNRGAGHPDGGFFTPDQYPKRSAEEPIPSALPSRGAIEVKSTSEDLRETIRSDQVAKYCKSYGLVLVTNFRSFALVSLDAKKRPRELEAFSLAETDRAFWDLVRHPRNFARDRGMRFVEFLIRVLRERAPLVRPEDVADTLAAYAWKAREKIEDGRDLPGLNVLRKALEEAVGLKFEGDKGEHFFRSTLVQTLFYGVFSAWVLWSEDRSPTDRTAPFDWRTAIHTLHVPMIRALYHQIATPTYLGPLGLTDILDRVGDALNRVDRAEFFQRFERDSAVQYFYEPFLAAYDSKLRKELGVWYTPPEIVRYQVERVDRVLRTELDVADGLADPNVLVLDPCCGTGAYLVETLRRIERTLGDKGSDALLGQALKEAATTRVFGFEILPAPFVVSHLQLGLHLRRAGAPLERDEERVGVFLTNALSGWEPPTVPKTSLPFSEFEAERDAADHVKQERKILVILGNPPYNAFAGTSPEEEGGIVEVYKDKLVSEWGIKKFNLDDLYVRFFRVAERRIVEKTGFGVVCFISNFSYLGESSFVVMRKRLLDGFHGLWIDSLNGDSRETGKLTPEGKPDPSVFSTPQNREGIRKGTAIGTFVRRPNAVAKRRVRFREFWGTTKREDLLASLEIARFDDAYQKVFPEESNRFSFRPTTVSQVYLSWPKLTDLCREAPINGLMEKRGGALIDIDRDALEARMKRYFDRNLSWEEFAKDGGGLGKNAARFEAKKARARLWNTEGFRPDNLRRYAVRPFDHRWCYYTGVRPVWNEPRPSLWRQSWNGNQFLLSRVSSSKTPEGVPFYFTTELSDDHLLSPDASCFPLRIRKDATGAESSDTQLFSATTTTNPNLSESTISYVKTVSVHAPASLQDITTSVWLHCLAIGYSERYLTENGDGIAKDWPRIPLPRSRDALENSATLGRQVAALLDVEKGVPDVTKDRVRPELRPLGVVTAVEGGQLNPKAGDLALAAGWGRAGKDGAVMPGRGRTEERVYSERERSALAEGAAAVGRTLDDFFACLGDGALDVYLNDRAYWACVPARVWEYRIGGYQVVKKWLSYRERDVLGRDLTTEEVHYVTDTIRRIAAILLLGPALDANYEAVKADTYPWPRAEDTQASPSP